MHPEFSGEADDLQILLARSSLRICYRKLPRFDVERCHVAGVISRRSPRFLETICTKA